MMAIGQDSSNDTHPDSPSNSHPAAVRNSRPDAAEDERPQRPLVPPMKYAGAIQHDGDAGQDQRGADRDVALARVDLVHHRLHYSSSRRRISRS